MDRFSKELMTPRSDWLAGFSKASQSVMRSYSLYKFFRWFSKRSNQFRLSTASNEIISAYAQSAMKLFPHMLSKRWNRFHICSASYEIVSQHALGCPCKNCQTLNASWAYRKIRSTWTQCAMKSFPYMLRKQWNRFHVYSARHAIICLKYPNKPS